MDFSSDCAWCWYRIVLGVWASRRRHFELQLATLNGGVCHCYSIGGFVLKSSYSAFLLLLTVACAAGLLGSAASRHSYGGAANLRTALSGVTSISSSSNPSVALAAGAKPTVPMALGLAICHAQWRNFWMLFDVYFWLRKMFKFAFIKTL